MKRCACCCAPAVWAWQPDGPGETPLAFAVLGSHHRGFPVVPVCDDHRDRIRAGESVTFAYAARAYTFASGELQMRP